MKGRIYMRWDYKINRYKTRSRFISWPIALGAIFALGCQFQIALASELAGRITFKGIQPAERLIVMDEASAEVRPEPATTRHYVVSKEGGLANVFVYISKGLEGKTFTPPTEPAELDQKGAMYEPYVQGIMAGQTLRIKNSDPLLHNVHSVTRTPGNREFNFAQPVQGQSNDKVFAKPEVMVKFKCDVHNWMFAYVGVLDHPFFAVSDTNGNYTIKNLPPGEYTVSAYHPKTHGTGTGLSKSIKVEEGKASREDFVVELKAMP